MDDLFSLAEGGRVTIEGLEYRMLRSIPRQAALVSEQQEQTATTFGVLWKRDDIFDESAVTSQQAWQQEYLPEGVEAVRDLFSSPGSIRVLDAGCGLGLSAYSLLKEYWQRIDYLGVDISNAVEVARQWLGAKNAPARLLQASFMDLPRSLGKFDLILALGTLHHSDSVGGAIKRLAPFLSDRGKLIIWVIGEQKPLRKVTDGFLRDYFQQYGPAEAREQMLSYSKLSQAIGAALGDMTIDVPEDVPCLDLKRGPMRLQTLLYDYVLTAYYIAGKSVDWINMSHFDWFYPRNYHQTNSEQMAQYLCDAGLRAERLMRRVNGITAVAVRGN